MRFTVSGSIRGKATYLRDRPRHFQSYRYYLRVAVFGRRTCAEGDSSAWPVQECNDPRVRLHSYWLKSSLPGRARVVPGGIGPASHIDGEERRDE
jgi:hypothetical protein